MRNSIKIVYAKLTIFFCYNYYIQRNSQEYLPFLLDLLGDRICIFWELLRSEDCQLLRWLLILNHTAPDFADHLLCWGLVNSGIFKQHLSSIFLWTLILLRSSISFSFLDHSLPKVKIRLLFKSNEETPSYDDYK